MSECERAYVKCDYISRGFNRIAFTFGANWFCKVKEKEAHRLLHRLFIIHKYISSIVPSIRRHRMREWEAPIRPRWMFSNTNYEYQSHRALVFIPLILLTKLNLVRRRTCACAQHRTRTKRLRNYLQLVMSD